MTEKTRATKICDCQHKPCGHSRALRAATDDDGCQPDCNPANVQQVAIDEDECSVCGFRSAIGPDSE